MKNYTYYILCAICIAFCVSCTQVRTGRIEGQISNAEGQLLVLEHLTDGAPRLVDTVRLDANGQFRFKPEVEDGPDFFSLRLGQQSVALVIDTLLTPVTLTADAPKMANAYEVADDLNKQLKEAVMVGNLMRRQMYDANDALRQGLITQQAYRDSIFNIAQNYKLAVLQQFIYQDPSSPASYYLLFETVQGMPLFDPNDRADNRAFGAVATGWQYKYPRSPRNRILERVTIEGQMHNRQLQAHAQRSDSLLMSKVVESTFPDLTLTNAGDLPVTLSEMVDGEHVVLLDFTAYYLPSSPAHNLALAGLYEKYKDRGLRIYQVCLDFDENFWKTSADNLPWTTVRDLEVQYDQQGNIYYSPAAMHYNVQQIPTSFLIGRDATIQGRIEDDAKLETEIRKLIP